MSLLISRWSPKVQDMMYGVFRLGSYVLAPFVSAPVSGYAGVSGKEGGPSRPVSLNNSGRGPRLPTVRLRLTVMLPPVLPLIVPIKVFMPSRLNAMENPPRKTVCPPPPKMCASIPSFQLGVQAKPRLGAKLLQSVL